MPSAGRWRTSAVVKTDAAVAMAIASRTAIAVLIKFASGEVSSQVRKVRGTLGRRT